MHSGRLKMIIACWGVGRKRVPLTREVVISMFFLQPLGSRKEAISPPPTYQKAFRQRQPD